MNEVSILIGGGDSKTKARIKTHAIYEGFTVDEAPDGISFLKMYRRKEYDILIIDTDLSELDTWSVCRQIRKNSETPIVIISDQNDEEEMLSYYGIGVDDFLTKPFSGKLVMARINIILRSSTGRKNYEPRRIIYEGLCIDTVSRAVYADGANVTLTPKEYNLLLYFAQNPYKAMSREMILQNVWGEDFFGTDRTVDTHVKMLREHIKPYGRLIDTVWGVGYIFKGN